MRSCLTQILQGAGPAGAFIAILSGVTAKYGISGLQVATLMAGVILVVLGIAKLVRVIKFIPQPVIVAYGCTKLDVEAKFAQLALAGPSQMLGRRRWPAASYGRGRWR